MEDNSNQSRTAVMSDVTIYCQQVKAGAKPVASIQVSPEHRDAVIRLCDHHKLLTFEDDCAGWVTIFIYTKPFMLDVIQRSLVMADRDAFEIFVRGSMYGYSLDNIEQFVNGR